MVYFLRVLLWATFCIVHTFAFRGLSPRSYLNTSSSSITLSVQVSPLSSDAPVTFAGKPESGTLDSFNHDRTTTVLTVSEIADKISERTSAATVELGTDTAPATPTQQPTTTGSFFLKPSDAWVEGEQNAASLRSSEIDSKQSAYVTPAPPSLFSSSSLRYPNATSKTRSFKSFPSIITSFCSSRRANEPYTKWIILPNPTTITILEGADYPKISYSSISEFTPPVYCPGPSTAALPYSTGPKVASEPLANGSLTSPRLPLHTPLFGTGVITTTFITTSKNPVTVMTTSAPPRFPVPGVIQTTKETVNLATVSPSPTSDVGLQSVDSVPIQSAPPAANDLQPMNVVIVDGAVFSAIGSSIVVFDSQTLTYDGTTTLTTTFHNEAITIGTAISFDRTTLGGAENSGTQLGIAGGITVTEIGQSVGVISSTSITVGPGVFPTTILVDEYTITAKSEGLELAGTLLSYPFNQSPETIPGEVLTSYKLVSTVVSTSASVGLSTHSAPETAAKPSKTSAATFAEPMYGLLGVCFIICIGNLR